MRAHAFFGHSLRGVPAGIHARASVATVLLGSVSVSGEAASGGSPPEPGLGAGAAR